LLKRSSSRLLRFFRRDFVNSKVRWAAIGVIAAVLIAVVLVVALKQQEYAAGVAFYGTLR